MRHELFDVRLGALRRTKGWPVMTAILGRFFHWPASDPITAEADRLLRENGGRALFRAFECELDAHRNHDQRQARYWHAVCRQIGERRLSRASPATAGLAQRPRETLVIERDETSPNWGFALILAMAVGASFWGALIWVVMRE